MSKKSEGQFIVLDGPDGTGKSTLARNIATALRVHGVEVVLTAEPYLPQTRAWLSDKSVSHRALAIAFANDRNVHLHERVLPALARGAFVICDRYVLSTLVYQTLNNPVGFVESLMVDVREPDLTLVLDAPTDVCMARLAKTGKAPDRFEERADWQVQVRRKYLRVTAERQAAGGNYRIVNANQPPDQLLKVALLHINERMGPATWAS